MSDCEWIRKFKSFSILIGDLLLFFKKEDCFFLKPKRCFLTERLFCVKIAFKNTAL